MTNTETEQALYQYEHESKMHQWKVIGVAAFTTVVTCLLLVFMLMPGPMLPLTSDQIGDLASGQLFKKVWSKMSKEEKAHLLKLADQVTHAG